MKKNVSKFDNITIKIKKKDQEERTFKDENILGQREAGCYSGALYSLILDLARDWSKGNILCSGYSNNEDALIAELNNKLKCEDSSSEGMETEVRKEYENQKLLLCADRINGCKIDDSFFSKFFLEQSVEKEGNKLAEVFATKYGEIRKNIKTEFFNKNLVDGYLKAYFDLCRFIFSSECYMQEEARDVGLLEDLLNVELCENPENGRKEFSLISPFVLYNLWMTIICISKLKKMENSDNDVEKLDSRVHMVSSAAINSLSRFTSIKGKSYRVDYCAGESCLLVKSIEDSPSLVNVRPVRLFEKIASQICKSIEADNNKQTINISIIGHTHLPNIEYDNLPNEHEKSAEYLDLIYELFSWIEDEIDTIKTNDIRENLEIGGILKNRIAANGSEKPTLTLNIKYLSTNLGNGYESYVDMRNYNASISSQKKYKFQSLFIVEEIKDNTLNRKSIDNWIKDSDTLFFLDSPCTVVEEFNMLNEGSMSTYANWMKSLNWNDAIKYEESREPFKTDNIFSSINDQFNRLSFDNTVKYGRVVRIPKGYLLDWISKTLEKHHKENPNDPKTVYIYNSSKRGMDYSEYWNYPLMRLEEYSKKAFYIMRFSSWRPKNLKLDKNHPLNIDLWSFLKYIDIPFVYDTFRYVLEENVYNLVHIDENSSDFDKKMAIRRNIISICRSIYFVFDLREIAKNSVNVEVQLADTILNLCKSTIDENAGINNITTFFNIIIRDVIFGTEDKFGSDSIRNAFERCVYNKAETVEHLFALSLYKISRKNNCLGGIEIKSERLKINEKKAWKHEEGNKYDDGIMDKKIYDDLFGVLDLHSPPSNKVMSSLKSVNKNNYKYDAKKILENIIKVCEMFSKTDGNLYRNACEYKASIFGGS